MRLSGNPEHLILVCLAFTGQPLYPFSNVLVTFHMYTLTLKNNHIGQRCKASLVTQAAKGTALESRAGPVGYSISGTG